MALYDPEPRLNIYLAEKFLKSSPIPDVLHGNVLGFLNTTSCYVDAIVRLIQQFNIVTSRAGPMYAICYRSTNPKYVGSTGKLKKDRRECYYVRSNGVRVYGIFVNAVKYTTEQRAVLARAVRDDTWKKKSFGVKTYVGINNDGTFVESNSFGTVDKNCVASFVAGQSQNSLTVDRGLDMCLYSCFADAPLLAFMVGVLYAGGWKSLPLSLICRKRVMFFMFKIVEKLKNVVLKRRFEDYVRRGIEAKLVSYNQICSIVH